MTGPELLMTIGGILALIGAVMIAPAIRGLHLAHKAPDHE